MSGSTLRRRISLLSECKHTFIRKGPFSSNIANINSSVPQNVSLAQASTITMSVVGILLMIIVSGYCVRMIKNRKNFIGNSHAKIDMESILPLQVNNFLYDICTGEGELSEITKLNKSQIKVGKLIGIHK